MKENNEVIAIKDRFHPRINGNEQPEVRSDHIAFEGKIELFLDWCKQHGANDNEIYKV